MKAGVQSEMLSFLHPSHLKSRPECNLNYSTSRGCDTINVLLFNTGVSLLTHLKNNILVT